VNPISLVAKLMVIAAVSSLSIILVVNLTLFIVSLRL